MLMIRAVLHRISRNAAAIRLIAAFSLALFAPAALGQLPAEEEPRVKVGEKAPEFTLKNQHGQSVTLKRLIGKKPTALVFFRSADW